MYKSRSIINSSNYKTFSSNVNNLYSSNKFQQDEIDFDTEIKSTFSSILKKNNKPTDLSENISLFMTRVETLASTLSDAKELKTENSDKKLIETKTKFPNKLKQIKIKPAFNHQKNNFSPNKNLFLTPKESKQSKIKNNFINHNYTQTKTPKNLPNIQKTLPYKKINMLKEKKVKLNTEIDNCIKRNTELNKEVLDWGTHMDHSKQGKTKLEQLLNKSSENFDYMNIHKSLGKVTIKPALELNKESKKKTTFIRIGAFPLDKVLKIDNLELYKFRKMILDKYRDQIEENPPSAEEIQYKIEREIRNRKHKIVNDILLKHSLKKRRLDSFLSKINKT